MRHLATTIAVVAVFSLTAWGRPKGVVDYGDLGTAPQHVSIIRPAEKEERRGPQPGVAMRIFVNPGGIGLAQVQGVRSVSGQYLASEKFNGVRVPPGNYLVTVKCTTGGWWGVFDLPVSVEAGGEYLLECKGNTAHKMSVEAFRK